MKRACLLLLACVSLQAQVSWVKPTQPSPWTNNGGFEKAVWDPISGTFILHVLRTFAGTVSVTNGSPTVTWVSGDKFSGFWHHYNDSTKYISISGTNVNISGVPTTCSANTNALALACTTLTLSSNWTGTSGTKSYAAAGTSIYSDTFASYNVGTNTLTYLMGWGSLDRQCFGDNATYNLPEARQAASYGVDTVRNRLYVVGGVINACQLTVSTNGTTTVTGTGAGNAGYFTQQSLWNGLTVQIPNGGTEFTITSVTDESHMVIACGGGNPACPNGATTAWVKTGIQKPLQESGLVDIGYLSLNASPASNAWTQLATSAIPLASDQIPYWNAMTYDAADDGLILFGTLGAKNTAVFCSTDGNPGGTLLSSQTAIGCVAGNIMNVVTPTGSTPTGIYNPYVIWDNPNTVVLSYGGISGGNVWQRDVYSYAPQTKVWSAKSSTNQPTATSIINSPAEVALNTNTNCMYVHVPDTPSDWSYCNGVSNAWNSVATTGSTNIPTCTSGGGACGAAGIMTGFDPATNQIFGYGQGNSVSTVWLGNVWFAPTITSSATLTAGTQNSAYTFPLTATGYPAPTWSITSGALPTGVSLNSSTGVISGTPTASGTFTFTVKASNTVSPDATQNASLTINPVCLITASVMPAAKFGIPYSQTVPTQGCASPTYSVSVGSLPTGLSINSGSGVISGTPTVTGISSFTISITDANGNPTQAMTLTVVPGPGVFSVTVGPGMVVR